MDSKYSVQTTSQKLLTSCSKYSKFLTKRKSQDANTEKSNNKLRKSEDHNGHDGKTSAKSNQRPSLQSSNTREQIEQQRKALPVTAARTKLMQEIKEKDTLLIMSETGSGKTTQIPQFLLEAGYATNGLIAITQPRRVAAISVAKRVAQEQNCVLGELVGYTVRFEDCTSSKTRIRFLTDGFLLREALIDRLLQNYSAIMLDEAHERTINTDVLFGIVKEAQNQRKLKNLTPLKIIIASATMDIDHFGRYFGVKGIYLEGRTHPVQVMHVKNVQSDYLQAVLITLFDIHRNTPTDHDVLVFLTGQEEIETTAQEIRKIAKTSTIEMEAVRVFTLYAQLPHNKQLACFSPTPSNVRKIVLATNIAETSITIPGIRCVIDGGFVKRRLFNPSTGLEVLRSVRISQAQAWQRCGRAGRDSPGSCYRTYTLREMNDFEKLPKPEILRTNIYSTVLQLLAMGIDCYNFDFLDRPSPEAIDTALTKLKSLGAIEDTSDKPTLTTLGRQMAQFPLDPHYSKMLLTASKFDCMEEMLSLVSVLSSDNVFINTIDKRDQAALAHAKFHSKHGDHLTLLNAFQAFQKAENAKVWCHDNFLNIRNLEYAGEARQQLLEIVERLDLKVTSCGQRFDQVRKCLLSGLFDNIAESQSNNNYVTISNRHNAKIHPSSVFHLNYRPPYLIYSEIVQTESNYLRQVTDILPEWLTEVVPNFPYLNRIRKLF